MIAYSVNLLFILTNLDNVQEIVILELIKITKTNNVLLVNLLV